MISNTDAHNKRIKEHHSSEEKEKLINYLFKSLIDGEIKKATEFAHLRADMIAKLIGDIFRKNFLCLRKLFLKLKTNFEQFQKGKSHPPAVQVKLKNLSTFQVPLSRKLCKK